MHLSYFNNRVLEKENAWIFSESCEQEFVEATENVQDFQSANDKLPGLLSKYASIFAKDKYDVGCLNMEPLRIYVTSDLPISLRAYRTSPKEG